MAKGQKRTSKQPRKPKTAEPGGKKAAGPKYLHSQHVPQSERLAALRSGQKSEKKQ
jgi:hypothetical protein